MLLVNGPRGEPDPAPPARNIGSSNLGAPQHPFLVENDRGVREDRHGEQQSGPPGGARNQSETREHDRRRQVERVSRHCIGP